MELKAYLEEGRARLDAYLDEYLSSPEIPARLLEAMRYSVFAGGKRVRPLLAMAAFEACGGRGDAVLALGSALEMIHTYSLIHDDLPAMDDDDVRRGRPTNHKVHGEALAILAGDGLLTQAFEILSDPRRLGGVAPDRRNRIIAEIAGGAGSRGMVGGQALDILAENRRIGPDALKDLHGRKTGALIRASVVSGALLAGADEESLRCCRDYGVRIGLAFQVVDDILDVTRTAEELGKSTSDRDRGKNTYPSVFGLEEARRLASDLLDGALEAVEALGPPAEALRAIARYIIARTN